MDFSNTQLLKNTYWEKTVKVKKTYLCKKEAEDGKQTEFSSGKGED